MICEFSLRGAYAPPWLAVALAKAARVALGALAIANFSS
jgi:hypothetical protein